MWTPAETRFFIVFVVVVVFVVKESCCFSRFRVFMFQIATISLNIVRMLFLAYEAVLFRFVSGFVYGFLQQKRIEVSDTRWINFDTQTHLKMFFRTVIIRDYLAVLACVDRPLARTTWLSPLGSDEIGFRENGRNSFQTLSIFPCSKECSKIKIEVRSIRIRLIFRWKLPSAICSSAFCVTPPPPHNLAACNHRRSLFTHWKFAS